MSGIQVLLLITVATVLACTAVLIGYAVRVARTGRPTYPRLGASPGSALLPSWLVEPFYWAMHAPASALVRLGIEPDALTYAAVALSCASVPFLARGRFGIAAVLVVTGALFDALDGMVARARGRASEAGAVLDSVLDRIADAAPFVGLAIFYRHRDAWLAVPLLALTTSSMVSYARAKADVYGLELPNGPMRRHERIVYLAIALVFGPLIPTPFAVPHAVTLALVGFIALGSAVATGLLVVRTRAALRAGGPTREAAKRRGGEPRGTRPTVPTDARRTSGGAHRPVASGSAARPAAGAPANRPPHPSTS